LIYSKNFKNMSKRIAIGCDHAGFSYKEKVVQLLEQHGYEVSDKGTNSLDSVDYPDFVHPVAEDVKATSEGLGIVMCGSGNGVAITANKYAGIRAALCWNSELAQLAREHNDANILAIPVRFIDEDTALKMVETFINTAFEGGRHQRRIDKINP
jgi:ribose 5-phosphate isomerase B